MTDKLLDTIAADVVSGVKAYFAHRVNAGEDPTGCIRTFLDFFEANKDSNRQLFRRIASRIDSTVFVPLKRRKQIASPGDFIAAYHDLVGKLVEIDPALPYQADYERHKALFEKAIDQAKDEILKEKQEKTRIVHDEYGRISSERKRSLTRLEGGSFLTYSLICAFALSGVLFLALIAPPGLEPVVGWISIVTLMVATIKLRSQLNWARWGLVCLLVFVFSIVFAHARSYPALFVTAAILGIADYALLREYGNRIAGILLTPTERAAHNKSIESIEAYFSQKEKQQMAQASLEAWADDVQ